MATLTQLAQNITTTTATIEKFLKNGGHQLPSFDVNGPLEFPDEAPADVKEARRSLIESARDLALLARYPMGYWLDGSEISGVSEGATHFILHFGIADAVPLKGSISYADLAKKTRTPERRVMRIIRYAMTLNMFDEPVSGFVAHTSFSAALVQSESAKINAGFTLDCAWPAYARVVEATERFGDLETTTNTAQNLRYGDLDKPFMTIMHDNDPKAFTLFSKGMEIQQANPKFYFHHIAKGFDWTSIGLGTVVDVGGGYGHVSAAVAREAPELRFVVQDQASALEGGKAQLPTDLQSRFTFMEHDFFKVNPVTGADVYLFRTVMHDWTDTAAAEILRGVVGAMSSKSRIIICDTIMPSPGSVPRDQERMMRWLDLTMMTINGIERSLEQWEELMKKADERLEIKNVVQPEGSILSIIEVRLREE